MTTNGFWWKNAFGSGTKDVTPSDLVRDMGSVGNRTAYETDQDGNRIEVTYDSTGKIVGRKKVGVGSGSEFSVDGSQNVQSNGGVPMNASNWQKLIDLLRSKFGISL